MNTTQTSGPGNQIIIDISSDAPRPVHGYNSLAVLPGTGADLSDMQPMPPMDILPVLIACLLVMALIGIVAGLRNHARGGRP